MIRSTGRRVLCRLRVIPATVLPGPHLLAVLHHDEIELSQWSLRVPCVHRLRDVPGGRDDGDCDARLLINSF
jgi:hypothetical protein